MKCYRFVVVLLCQLLVLQPVFGQQAASRIRIAIVEGAEARNVVQQIASRPLRVRVQDEANRPVFGATVTFAAPESGPGGEFENDSFTMTVTTDAEGLAVARGYHPNGTEGSYGIQVRAEFQGQTAAASITQINIAQRKTRGKLLAILAIAGAAVGAAVVAGSNEKTVIPPEVAPTIAFGGGAAVGVPSF